MTDAVETILLEEKAFAVLVDMRQRVNETLARFNAANEDAKSKKKAYEASREAFEREFDRLVAKTRGKVLPLFSQSDKIEAANNDPIVRRLVERLIDAGHDVNALVVFGYTELERNQVTAYLDARDAHAKARADGTNGDLPDVEVPAFLLLQDDEPLSDEAVDDWITDLQAQGLEVSPERVRALTTDQRHEVGGWLDAVTEIHARKGEAVTVDDLPAPPVCLMHPVTSDQADGASAEAEA
jgi:hypothetical protein